MEHRWGQRVRVDIPVRLESPPVTIGDARILDLSVSGAWISGDFQRHISAEIEVIFDLPPRTSRHSNRIRAYVARARREGIGVEWRELAPPLISELLGNPAAADGAP
jgi:hypothetical protein